MSKQESLNVVIATTEVVPFSKVGGLADVIGSLSIKLAESGCKVSIFTPLYKSIDRKKFGIRKIKGISTLHVKVDGVEYGFDLYSTTVKEGPVEVYFIRSKEFYDREGIYTEADGEAYEDEAERTIFLNLSILEALRSLGIKPDIIHANDFHTGLIPAYIRLSDPYKAYFEDTASVFSIHNLAYQGNFKPEFMRKAGFDQRLFAPMSPFEFYGSVNVMKIAISFADKISTVSETYAKEISSTPEFGYGLEGVLKTRGDDLVGILNGIDTELWNPEKDELIPYNYSAKDLSGKKKNRIELLKEFGLPSRTRAPVIGIVSRLVDQKGFDILAEAFETLMKLNLKIVILGTGQKKYHDIYSELASKHSKKFGLKLEFNNRLAHLIEAGSDFFLMPSRYEPCGLNQMYSLRYGTVPIVRETGGLKDTIRDLDKHGKKGNGFTFESYTAEALFKAVERAVAFFNDRKAFNALRRRIMQEDHSWQRSAAAYYDLYRSAMEKKRMGLTTAQM